MIPHSLDKYKSDLERLVRTGQGMLISLRADVWEYLGEPPEKKQASQPLATVSFMSGYQSWYSEACALLRQVMRERLAEFESLYHPDPRRKALGILNYTIRDWWMGLRASTHSYSGERYFLDAETALEKFRTQVGIIDSVNARFDSSLFDIQRLLQADLFDSELDAARELLTKGFVRPSGALAGVVLERHLAQVANDHQLRTRKKHPTISDWNDLLKNAGVIDTPAWRYIQRLADLRNLCGHQKDQEPTKAQVGELLDGCEKMIKTIA